MSEEPKSKPQHRTWSEIRAGMMLEEQAELGMNQQQYDAYRRRGPGAWDPMTALDRLPPLK
jgi:hypothetical protein